MHVFILVKPPTSAMHSYDTYVIYLLMLKLFSVMHCCRACNTAEYQIDDQCCPMCSPGHHVLKHCDNNTGTMCKVCTGTTYNDVPNGLTACLACTVCDKGNGLKVKHKCLYNSDALCETMPGYYCIEGQHEGCRKAREHSTCLPGQYIYQTGTALLDTLCKDCSEKTYSNGSAMHCEPHTNCESLGQITIIQGTQSTDTVCSHKPPHLGLIIGMLLLLIVILLVVLVVLLQKKKLSRFCTNHA